jgi:hypothetical protein
MSTDVRRFEETQTFPLWGYAVLAAGTLAGSAGIAAATRGAAAQQGWRRDWLSWARWPLSPTCSP